MREFEEKKIILAITPDVNLYKSFEKNLRYLGFEVYLICNKKFKYRSLKDKLINFYKKQFKKDQSYKRELARKYNAAENHKLLLGIPNTDYSLTIRADLFDENTIKTIISKSTNNYSYQWDGLRRFPEVEKLIHFFKKFYVFDKRDLIVENTWPTTNFYFDCYQSFFDNKESEYDAYFIGSYDNRIYKLIEICEFLASNNLKLNIILCTSPKKHLKKYSYIKYIKSPISYEENLKIVANSKMLIDLHHEKLHQGLSFRTFEALGYDKKLITTNAIVANYEFYNPNNILILSDQYSKEGLNKFLKKNYKPVNLEIKKKYSFTNWINYILEKPRNISINIP